jgi:outer membrane murein-binding lipoprotein Lpp
MARYRRLSLSNVVLWASLALAGGLAFAQNSPAAPATVAVQDLQADVDILEHAYRELHPGLLRYLTPRALAAVDRLLANTP